MSQDQKPILPSHSKLTEPRRHQNEYSRYRSSEVYFHFTVSVYVNFNYDFFLPVDKTQINTTSIE